MKRQLWKALLSSLGAMLGLVLACSVQAQVERELFLISYPDAKIDVDGNASDWNLAQFGSFIVGGVVGGETPWERVTGTGDIARLGWDDEDENLFYAGNWTGAVLPEAQADHSVKVYARDDATHQYFLVDITDDEINTGDEAAWANDSVEFYIDPENNGDPTDWTSDVQLVIDAGNQVQVWNSPVDYKQQVEAGVTSAVTITETGWMVEVGIDKNVFSSPLPAVLGPANDPAGNNYGIDFSFRDNDDPGGTGNRGGDTTQTTAYDWADPSSGGGFPSKQASLWGAMIAPTGPIRVPGDINGDEVVDMADFEILAANFNSQVESLQQGDLDLNRRVDLADFLLFRVAFNEANGNPGVAAVPEPTSVVLLAVGGLIWTGRRRSVCRRQAVAKFSRRGLVNNSK